MSKETLSILLSYEISVLIVLLLTAAALGINQLGSP